MTVLAASLILAILASAHRSALAGDIGFVEDFSLAPNRDAALKTLIPGSEDFYYFHCLHYQNSGQLDKVDPTFKTWAARYAPRGEGQYNDRMWQIKHRQALLQYEQQPQVSLEYLRARLNVHFNHQRQAEVDAANANLPSTLDDNTFDLKRLMEQNLGNRTDTGRFESLGLELLAADPKLLADNTTLRHSLLTRLTRPDYPGLVKLVSLGMNDDLDNTSNFGNVAIHYQLTRAQFDELLKLHPRLIHDNNFVNAYLSKLRPGDDVDMNQDLAARKAYLEGLWEFTKPLAPAFNSLKANVLHSLLDFNRRQNAWNQALFIEYLKLPRQCRYIEPRYFKDAIDNSARRSIIADLNANFGQFIVAPPVGNDEPLVRDYLLHFLAGAENYNAFDPYVESNYLRAAFAEANLLAGKGDPEKWFGMMAPEQVQALKERVDVDLALANKLFFRPDEPVTLTVATKNVKELIVKVYTINTMNYYRATMMPISTDIDLDGLVANVERTETFNDAPIRRVERTLELPEIAGRGVFIVELIGNGKSSRALIQKGNLFLTDRVSAAGQVLTIWNESNEKVADASVFVSGQLYSADTDGHVTVPFTAQGGNQPIILHAAGLARLAYYRAIPEQYAFRAGIYIDRESLLRRRDAQVIVRPSLQIAGTPVSVHLLENVHLEIATTDREGVRSVKRVNDLTLFDDKETAVSFRVPDNILDVTCTLRAQIKSMATRQPIDLTATQSFPINQIDTTAHTQDLHLMHVDGDYMIELLGKTGEIQPNQAVRVTFKHRFFTQTIHATLKTDANGRIHLGKLPRVDLLRADAPQGFHRTWTLPRDQRAGHDVVHGQSMHRAEHGQALGVVFVPYLGQADKVTPENFSLLETRGGTFVVDRTAELALTGDGYLTTEGLAAGDYSLRLKETGQEITIRLAAGPVVEGYVMGATRKLEFNRHVPLNIVDVSADNDTVTIQLGGVTEFTRVHLVATRYQPNFSILGHLFLPVAGLDSVTSAYPPSLYVSGRDIGDEYRYILERKSAAKFPGNMLARPGLLLNPWAIRKTETGTQQAHAGSEYEMQGENLARGAGGRMFSSSAGGRPGTIPPHGGNLDFLSQTSAVLASLTPDENGLVTVKRANLGAHQQIHVLAVDTESSVYRELALPEQKMPFLDLRLMKEALPADKHFTERKQITPLQAGGQLVINDIGASRVETFDSLESVYRLYSALTNNPTLAEFNFILAWPGLNDEQKREKWSRYACHELAFFLYHKDRPFFDTVILPYLKNKKDKTFMDHYLLGNDQQLKTFTDPWAYRRLNAAERVLLAQRLADESARTARHVEDVFNLTPPNVERFNFLYNTALLSGGLDRGPRFGLRIQDGQSARELRTNLEYAAADADGERSYGYDADEDSPMLDASQAPAPMIAENAKSAAATPRAATAQADKADRAATTLPGTTLRRTERQPNDLIARVPNFAGAELELGERVEAMRQRREATRQFYRKLEATEELVENNYYRLPIGHQNESLIPVNGFWLDYAKYTDSNARRLGRATNFLSPNFIHAANTFSEMMLALAVLDLPFAAEKHDMAIDDAKLTLKAASPMIVFHKETKPAADGQRGAILVGQNYFRQDDRHRDEGNERFDKYVTDEFLIGVVYGCQVVVTNPTSTPRKLDVLVQIPQGALPVDNTLATKSIHVQLAPYATQTLEYFFYWPKTGQFTGLPVQVSKDEQLVGFAEPMTFKVVRELTQIDRTSWEYVSQHGSGDDVLAFLKDNNVERLNLYLIAWRMADAKFFGQTLALLRDRHMYENTLWSYGIKHNDVPAVREFLLHQDHFVYQCGLWLSSPLLSIDPVTRTWYQHMEYAPVVNARAHQLGKTRTIVNERIFQQYSALLEVLKFKPALNDEDRLAVTYYLLLQDRVEEGLACLKSVDAAKLAERLQYDYLQAYAGFYTEDLAASRELTTAYKDYPVDRWRKLFEAVGVQLDELDGAAAGVVDEQSRDQAMGKLAATEPGLEFTVEGGKVKMTYQNLGNASVRVNYYLMDVELLFSKNPFVEQSGATSFAYVQPNATADLKLPDFKAHVAEPAVKTFTFDLPKEMAGRNVMIEITAGAVKRQQAYYANTMVVTMLENYGQVKVADDKGKALAKAYVKVYARMKTGQVRFYKDGYTDLRGRFDYASLNTDDLDNVERFSILVVSPDNGALVRSAAPPKQ